MTILITGANGQLGRCLQDKLHQLTASADRLSESDTLLLAEQLQGIPFVALTSAQLDITDRDAVQSSFIEVKPRVVINAAAYTAVDRAEEDQERAYAVNRDGVRNLAEACAQQNAALVHVSTDYVFPGDANTPYTPEDATNALGVYGESKLQGEIAAASQLERLVILRTAWVYSEYGQNFVKTMLRLAASRDELSVVDDQIGSPTYAGNIALATMAIAAKMIAGEPCQETYRCQGTYHYVDKGVMSWHAFAEAIFQGATSLGMIKKSMKVNAIPSSEYPTPTKRPSYSVLDVSSLIRDFAVNQVDCVASLESVLRALSAESA